jgi:hypothetical protein
MKNVDNFKIFVRKHPELISYVKNNEMTWQKFYELWYLYGEDDNTWNKYIKPNNSVSITDFRFKDIVNMVKGINLDAAQKSITNIQKAISLVQDIIGNKGNTTGDIYTPRPIYQHFED